MESKAMRVIISLLISAAVFLLVLFSTFYVACFFSPPYIVDENDYRHGLMPLGQVIIALLSATCAGIFCMFKCYDRIIRK